MSIFVFRIYASFDSCSKTGIDLTLIGRNEELAIAKAKDAIKADQFLVREVIEKILWEKSQEAT